MTAPIGNQLEAWARYRFQLSNQFFNQCKSLARKWTPSSDGNFELDVVAVSVGRPDFEPVIFRLKVACVSVTQGKKVTFRGTAHRANNVVRDQDCEVIVYLGYNGLDGHLRVS
jgi:hypothetical protein